MTARALLATAFILVAAACGDTSVTGDGPAATTPSTVAPVRPATTAPAPTTTIGGRLEPTTTTDPGWGPAAARALYDEIADFNGWTIPDVALPDFAADACSRDLWEPVEAFAFGEVLLYDDFLDWRIANYDRSSTVRAARLGWALGAMTCPDRFPAEALAAGPPELRDYPSCDLLGWRPHALPWTADIGPADRVTAADDGTLELAWSSPAGGAFTITFGRGDVWAAAVADGNHVAGFGAGQRGPVRRDGYDAHVVAADDTLTVAWEGGPEFCSAMVASLSPTPAAAPLDVMARIALEPLAWSINDAELRMSAAIAALAGFDDIGGEPSHGGGDAVYWLSDSDGIGYFFYAIPIEEFPSLRRSGVWTDVGDRWAAGHAVALFLPPVEDGLTARTVVDGFALEVTADIDEDALLDFMGTWIEAWQAAAGA